MRHDYTTIGHVTVDLLPDGTRRPGGGAFYSALQAARLGLRARIITRGDAREIGQLLAPYHDELELDVLDGLRTTTTMLTSGSGRTRTQRVLTWAGPIEDGLALDTGVLHLAPIARETPTAWSGRHELLGLTPQGLLREWRDRADAQIHLEPPEPAQTALAARCDALVLSDSERASAAALIAAARGAGATVAITAGAASKTLLLPRGEELRLDPAPVRLVRDDLGAGDVFAAAFFACLHERMPVREAARFASTAAALRLEGDGPAAIASRELIERRLAELSAQPARRL